MTRRRYQRIFKRPVRPPEVDRQRHQNGTDGKAACSQCGRQYKPTGDGRMRNHDDPKTGGLCFGAGKLVEVTA